MELVEAEVGGWTGTRQADHSLFSALRLKNIICLLLPTFDKYHLSFDKYHLSFTHISGQSLWSSTGLILMATQGAPFSRGAQMTKEEKMNQLQEQLVLYIDLTLIVVISFECE